MSDVKYCRCAFRDADGTVAAGERCEIHAAKDLQLTAESRTEREEKQMSAVARDRKEQALGKFLCTSDGADAFRDACGNDLVHLIGQLAICGDKAAIGSLVIDYLLADKGMQNSMAFASGENTKQLQRELFVDHFPSWERFREYDRETGIAVSGPI